MTMVKMFGPPGTDECNHGEMKFSRHEDGSFWVIPEAVEPLCRVGGFIVAVDQSPPITAAHIAELVAEEAALLLAPKPSPMRLTIPA
jgi:hypothetical protein